MNGTADPGTDSEMKLGPGLVELKCALLLCLRVDRTAADEYSQSYKITREQGLRTLELFNPMTDAEKRLSTNERELGEAKMCDVDVSEGEEWEWTYSSASCCYNESTARRQQTSVVMDCRVDQRNRMPRNEGRFGMGEDKERISSRQKRVKSQYRPGRVESSGLLIGGVPTCLGALQLFSGIKNRSGMRGVFSMVILASVAWFGLRGDQETGCCSCCKGPGSDAQ